jgi:hypothetical protein
VIHLRNLHLARAVSAPDFGLEIVDGRRLAASVEASSQSLYRFRRAITGFFPKAGALAATSETIIAPPGVRGEDRMHEGATS